MWPARARQGAAAAPCRSIAALMRRPSSECLSFRCEGGTDSSRVASEQGGKSGGVIFWHDVCTDGRERVGGTVGLGATDGRTDGHTRGERNTNSNQSREPTTAKALGEREGARQLRSGGRRRRSGTLRLSQSNKRRRNKEGRCTHISIRTQMSIAFAHGPSTGRAQGMSIRSRR